MFKNSKKFLWYIILRKLFKTTFKCDMILWFKSVDENLKTRVKNGIIC
jgi:hypothetical protein